MANKQSEIRITVGLDEQAVPETIHWQASDHPQGQGPMAAKALLLSIFDEEHRDTLKFDIWTKEMQVQEMDRMVYYTLRSLADTYLRATSNKELAGQMQQFASYFGQQTEILQK